MSESDKYTKNLQAVLTCTPREYYEYRLLAITYKVPFTVEWSKDACIIQTEERFLMSKGYIKGLDYYLL